MENPTLPAFRNHPSSLVIPQKLVQDRSSLRGARGGKLCPNTKPFKKQVSQNKKCLMGAAGAKPSSAPGMPTVPPSSPQFQYLVHVIMTAPGPQQSSCGQQLHSFFQGPKVNKMLTGLFQKLYSFHSTDNKQVNKVDCNELLKIAADLRQAGGSGS